MASILVLTSALDLLIKDKSSEVENTMQSMEETAKDLFTGTKSFIWSMDPESDSLKEIVAYIQHFAVDLLKNGQIDFVLDPPINESEPVVLLPMGASRQLYFIMKEAITNAMVHSQATKLTLSYIASLDRNHFEMALTDNGIGIEKEREFGKGLHNMKERAKKIDCHLSYFNNQPAGFTVKLEGNLSST